MVTQLNGLPLLLQVHGHVFLCVTPVLLVKGTGEGGEGHCLYLCVILGAAVLGESPLIVQHVNVSLWLWRSHTTLCLLSESPPPCPPCLGVLGIESQLCNTPGMAGMREHLAWLVEVGRLHGVVQVR